MAENQNTETKNKLSVWRIFGKIGSVFGIVFSVLMMILSFLIATPFFILATLLNWVKTFIGFAIFWALALVVYYSFILDTAAPELDVVYSNTNLLWLMGLSLVAAIMITVADMKE